MNCKSKLNIVTHVQLQLRKVLPVASSAAVNTTSCSASTLLVYRNSSSPDEVIDFFSIYLILPDALGPGVHTVSNGNEYQKQKNNVSGE
jgi:hypothetical protein